MKTIAEALTPGVRTLICDRDGTLLRLVPDTSVQDPAFAGRPPGTPEEVELYPGAAELLLQAQRLLIAVMILSNQGGLNEQLDGSLFSEWQAITREQYQAVHDAFLTRLQAAGVQTGRIAIEYCPHSKRLQPRCPCRKPELGEPGGTGLVARAASRLALSPEQRQQAIVVGDGVADFQLAQNLGMPFFLVATGHYQATLQGVREATGVHLAPYRLW